MADLGILLWRRGKQDIMQDIYMIEEGTMQQTNATQALIGTLAFAQSKTVRTSTIILAVFNILAALGTAASILYDCYRATKRNNAVKMKFCLTMIHPAEAFPLILSIGIIIQCTIFAGAQATGMTGLFTDGCAVLSQFVFPAIFLVPYIQIVFGLECALRSLRKGGFPARKKYDVTICLGIITLMLICTWIPTFIRTEVDHCFASLVWFVTRYGREGFILMLISMGLAIISASIIFNRLSTIMTIDQQQRIAASRMVYYLVLAVVSMTFVVPWFTLLTMGKPNSVASMMATVVLNLHGILTAVLQVFLRSNTAITAILPKGAPSWSRRGQLKLWGPNELGFGGHLLEPVSGPRSPGSIGSKPSSIAEEKKRSASIGSTRSLQGIRGSQEMEQLGPDPTELEENILAKPGPSAVVPPKTVGHTRKRSYSVFPQNESAPGPVNRQRSASDLPVLRTPDWGTRDVEAGDKSSPRRQLGVQTRYAGDDILLLPPSLHLIGGASHHRRDSSMVSSATVQIGLRLSNVVDDLAETASIRNRALWPQPRLQTQNLATAPNPSLRPSPLQNSETLTSTLTPAVRSARMKTLPPIPRVSTASVEPAPATKLSPTVYSPQPAKGSAASQSRSPLTRSTLRPQKDPLGSPPRATKSDWI